MNDNSAAEDCLALKTGLPIEGQDVAGFNGEAFAPSVGDGLRSVVLERIVPSLALMHREWKRRPSASVVLPQDIEAFAEAILADDARAADGLFQRLRDRGVGLDDLFESLLAPTARRFGELWAEDRCDFVDVTVGVNRLRMMLEAYAGAPTHTGGAPRCALLIATPSERHIFGLDMVAAFLRASGWDAVLTVGADARDNARTVSQAWFAVAGVTVSEEARLEATARAVEAVRRASVNRNIAVIAGGKALQGRPDLVARIGADVAAHDGPSAVLAAQKLYLAQTAMAAAIG
jgi:MerR family transcriptional regulator, light-induced transcriptional regulator